MYTDFITWIDLLLVPLYFFLLLAVMAFIKKRNPQNQLVQKYLLKGFVFKSFFALFYAALVYFYYGFGDTLTYFQDALWAKAQIRNPRDFFDVMSMDPKTAKQTFDLIAGGTDSGWFIERISIVISYLSFDRVLVATLIFAAIAYAGMFKMFQAFVSAMPAWHARVALIVLFFPSVSLYGSGILKDTLCIAALGWMIYCLQQLITKKNYHIKYFIVLIISITLIAILKIYILAAFVPPFILFIIIKAIRKIESPVIRTLALPLLISIIVIAYFSLAESIDSKLGAYAVENLLETVKDQQKSYLAAEDSESGSTFDIGVIEPSFASLIAKAPLGITATLYRPFIWETRKPIMLFSALESLVILFFTIYVIFKTGLLKFFRIIYDHPFILLCLTYAIVFAALVGLSTLNFGTLARYRIPVIPFFLGGLLAILYESKLLSLKKQRENIA